MKTYKVIVTTHLEDVFNVEKVRFYIKTTANIAVVHRSLQLMTVYKVHCHRVNETEKYPLLSFEDALLYIKDIQIIGSKRVLKYDFEHKIIDIFYEPFNIVTKSYNDVTYSFFYGVDIQGLRDLGIYARLAISGVPFSAGNFRFTKMPSGLYKLEELIYMENSVIRTKILHK